MVNKPLFGWISVKEWLPIVLEGHTCSKLVGITDGEYIEDDRLSCYQDGEAYWIESDMQVTHWIPLPNSEIEKDFFNNVRKVN